MLFSRIADPMTAPLSRYRHLIAPLAIALLIVAAGVAIILARKPGQDGKAAPAKLSAAQLPPIHGVRDPQAVALIPAGHQFVEPGKLTVAVGASQLPLGDYAADGVTVIGSDPDIARLVADSLGLDLNLVVVAWPDWPLGVESGKYDAALFNITVTEERKKKYDFSTYRNDQLGIYVKTDSPITAIREPKDIAGLRIVVGASTNQDQILRRWDAQNVAAGLKPVQPQYFDETVLGRFAVLSGRADATFEPNADGAYMARDGKTRLVGLFSGGWPQTAYISVTTRKGSGLADAITHALNTQIADGTYAKVLQRWNLTAEAIPKSQTNPPGLAAH
jgi:polar amino acid transport system substrate-binding protein